MVATVVMSSSVLINEEPRTMTTEDEAAGRHHRLHGHEFERAPGVGDGQGSLACCSLWDCKESDTTEQLNRAEGPGPGSTGGSACLVLKFIGKLLSVSASVSLGIGWEPQYSFPHRAVVRIE